MIAELNGRPVEVGELASLGLYNYGHFTSLLVDHFQVKGLDLHLDRLMHDCVELFSYRLDRNEVRRLLRKAAAGIDRPWVMRVTVFDPDLDLGHPGDDLHPAVLVTTRPAPDPDVAPLTLGMYEHTRAMPHVKHVGLFTTIVARRAAQLQGFDDVVFHDRQGRISEGATWNIGFIDADGTVILPDGPCLSGVTIRLLIDVMNRSGQSWAYEPLTIDDLPRMRAGFATNAAIGVRPVSLIGAHRLDPARSPLAELRRMYAGIAPDLL